MKKLVFKTVGTVSFIAAMSIPNAAYACCDSFWSCAGAVATAGLSCVVEELHKQADKLIASATQTIGLARKTYDDANAAINNSVNEARSSAFAAIGDAPAAMDASYNHIQSMLNAPKIVANLGLPNSAAEMMRTPPAATGGSTMLGGGNTASAGSNTGSSKTTGGMPLAIKPGSNGNVAAGVNARADMGMTVSNAMPPDEQEVRSTLNQALKFVDTLRNQARTQHIPHANNIVSQLESKIANDLRGIGNQVQNSILGPLQRFIDDLRKYDPTGLASLIGTALSGIDSAINLVNDIASAVATVDGFVADKITELSDPVNTLYASADLAREIEKAVKALASTPTKAELKKLQSLLPPQPKPKYEFAAIASLHGTANVGATRMFRVKRMQPINKAPMLAIKEPLANLSAELKSPLLQTKLQASPASQFNLQQFSSKTDQLLAQEFAGMSPAQKASKQQQMLSEARSRFGKDPKALQEVEKLINQGTNIAINASVRNSVAQSVALPINAASAPMLRPNTQILQPGIVR